MFVWFQKDGLTCFYFTIFSKVVIQAYNNYTNKTNSLLSILMHITDLWNIVLSVATPLTRGLRNSVLSVERNLGKRWWQVQKGMIIRLAQLVFMILAATVVAVICFDNIGCINVPFSI